MKKQSTKPKQQIVDFDPEKRDISKYNKKLLNHLISNNFLNSPVVGYLEKKSESWFGGWTEKFCVLTNVGLLYYNDPQKRPRNLFPCIDAKVTPISEGTYSKKFVFRLKSFTYNIIFAARNKDEYDKWLANLDKLNKETEKRKQQILKSKNLETLDKFAQPGERGQTSVGVRQTVRNFAKK